MLWYFLEWSVTIITENWLQNFKKGYIGKVKNITYSQLYKLHHYISLQSKTAGQEPIIWAPGQGNWWKWLTLQRLLLYFYRVPKWWRHKHEICEIIGFVEIFWKNNVQDVYSPKISNSGQIVSEILAQLCCDDSIQILLNLAWFIRLGTR